jgi:Flp pilus assembly protein TadG
MPAGVLVLLLLGAIAVDAAIAFVAQRELANATAAAANDAAVAGLDEAAFYADGRLTLEPVRATEAAAAAFAARRASWLETGTLEVRIEEVDGHPVRVKVSAEATVDLIFARAVPGAPGNATVSATSTATAQEARAP